MRTVNQTENCYAINFANLNLFSFGAEVQDSPVPRPKMRFSEEDSEMATRQNLEKGRSFRVPMAINRPSSGSIGGASRRRMLTRVVLGLALFAVAMQPAAATTVRMVCLVVDLEGDGLQLGDRHLGVPFSRASSSAAGGQPRMARRGRQAGGRWPISISRAPAATATGSSLPPIARGRTFACGSTTTTTAIRTVPALDFAQGLKMDGGRNLETAWGSVSVRPRSGGTPATSARKVTEVHLPLLSAPTAAVGTPVPLNSMKAVFRFGLPVLPKDAVPCGHDEVRHPRQGGRRSRSDEFRIQYHRQDDRRRCCRSMSDAECPSVCCPG
jgi:hypothetical protein